MSNAVSPWYDIQGKAETEGEVMIYGDIGFKVSAADFISQLKEKRYKSLTVHINSGGGEVFDGLAIYNYLKNFSGRTVVIVDGLAASMASVIAMAGDEIRMSDNSFLMIHKPSGGVIGDARQMKKMADVLDKIAEQLADIYSKRTGMRRETILNLMEEETWFNSEEAKENGFIDGIFKGMAMAAKLDLSKYNFKNKSVYEKPKNMENILDKIKGWIGKKEKGEIVNLSEEETKSVETCMEHMKLAMEACQALVPAAAAEPTEEEKKKQEEEAKAKAAAEAANATATAKTAKESVDTLKAEIKKLTERLNSVEGKGTITPPTGDPDPKQDQGNDGKEPDFFALLHQEFLKKQ